MGTRRLCRACGSCRARDAGVPAAFKSTQNGVERRTPWRINPWRSHSRWPRQCARPVLPRPFRPMKMRGLSGLCQRPLGICRGCHAWPESAPVGPGTAYRLSCATVFSSRARRTRTGPRRGEETRTVDQARRRLCRRLKPRAPLAPCQSCPRDAFRRGGSRTSNPADPDPRARW